MEIDVQHDETWRRLHERLRGIARRRAALDAEEARCLREAHDMKLWRQLGYAHMNEYLERELGYPPQVGIERLRIALALATLPGIEASLGEGWLPYSAIRELTRVATADTEQEWLDRVRGKNLRQIEALVSGKKRGDRPDDPGDPDLTMRVVRLELAPAVFALFRQVQSAMADEHGGRLDDSGLIEVLCRRALEGAGNAERPAHQIAITVCDSCGRGWQNGAGREVDVGREVVDRARCDAELIGRVDAEEPERLRTTVTPRVRRQVLARDHHRCTVPGCRSARNLDLHHIEYQRDGGGNEMWNVATLCSAHHARLHEGLLTIRGRAPDALEFVWRRSSGELTSPVVETARRLDRSAPIVEAVQRPDGTEPVIEAVQRPDGTEPVIEAVQRPDRSEPIVEAVRRPHRPGPVTGVDLSRSFDGIAPAEADIAMQSADAAGREPRSDRARTAMIDEDARAALVTAGYRTQEARAAVQSARPHVGPSATLEQVIREALRQCSVRRKPAGHAQASEPRARP